MRSIPDILREAKFLINLGPYGGTAANRFVEVMQELIECVEEFHVRIEMLEIKSGIINEK